MRLPCVLACPAHPPASYLQEYQSTWQPLQQFHPQLLYCAIAFSQLRHERRHWPVAFLTEE